jgi:hypothetical protein
MRAWYGVLFGRVRAFFISPSVKGTIKTSHIVIIGLMLIPLFVSLVISLFNTVSYDRLISMSAKPTA